MSHSFPNRGAMPSQQGYALSSSTGAAAAQQGMVRIHRGGEVRYIWPVHLAGWLSSGWRTGEENRSPLGDTSAVAAVVIPEAPAQDILRPEPMGTPPASTDPTLTPVAESDEPVSEPIEAILPTNLLDLDLEPVSQTPAPLAASSESAATPDANPQGDSQPNDAVSASLTGADQDGADAAETASLVSPDAFAAEEPAAVSTEEPAAPAETEPPQEEPAPPPTPARRGRPRKLRLDGNSEATAEAG